MYLIPSEVTAVVPGFGPVAWAKDTVDQYARDFLVEHQPKGVFWRLFGSGDDRECSGCRSRQRWQDCPFALWARSWQAERKMMKWPGAVDFLAADTVPNVAAPA